MNPESLTPPNTGTTLPRVEFFRLPASKKRDPHFGLSRGWYYKKAALGEIKMVSVRQRNALRGVSLVVYDSVRDYIRRSMGDTATKNVDGDTPRSDIATELPLFAAVSALNERV